HIRADHGAMKQLLDGFGGEEPAIEVPARHTADDTVVGGVDVIRADLERLDLVAPRRQGAHDGGGDGGFPHAAGGAGDDDGFRTRSTAGYGRKYPASAAGGQVRSCGSANFSAGEAGIRS